MADTTVRCMACSYLATYTSQQTAWNRAADHENRVHDGAQTVWTEEELRHKPTCDFASSSVAHGVCWCRD